jgi:hypothetical protein
MYRFTFNWLIYYSSKIISRGLHVSCYTAPILTAYQLFNFYLLLMCDIIFTHMSQATSSYFAKYFHDVYLEYITSCGIMIYAMPDASRSCLHGCEPYAQGLRSSPTEWIIQRIADKGKLASPFILFKTMNKFFHIIYYPLYMLIMQVYPDFGRMVTPVKCPTPIGRHDSGRMPDSDRKTRLRSYPQQWSEDATPVVSPTLVHREVPRLMAHPSGNKIWTTSQRWTAVAKKGWLIGGLRQSGDSGRQQVSGDASDGPARPRES